ncbi:MAG: Verru Chthon cassette protein [Verrucomicrobiales bacterium]|nr:Verru Chthon cassette protein [Verrucomicrobiales bacterium]
MKLSQRFSAKRLRSAFSLIELMVSVAVLSMILVIVFQMLEQMQKTWKRTRQSVSEFKDARNGFEEMGRRLGQATMNAYFGYDYVPATLQGIPVRYGKEIIRQSELHFVSGPSSILFGNSTNKSSGSRPGHGVFFQAPFGFCYDRDKENKNRLQYEQLNNLLNAWGYYVQFNTDEADRPNFLNALRNAPKPRARYRLMEFRQPTEYLQVYKIGLRDLKSPKQTEVYRWFGDGLFSVNSPWNTQIEAAKDLTFFRTTRPIAENILAMIIQPRESLSQDASKKPESLAPDFLYDTRRWQWSNPNAAGAAKSRHQLPPILDVSFIAVDETSFATYAARLGIDAVDKETKIFPVDLFTKGAKLEEDFTEAEEILKTLKLEYRIFSTSIRLRESKWTDTTP